MAVGKGERYQYSGEGLEYLRKALEIKFGKSLNELAAGLVFSPLSMSDTQYVFNDFKEKYGLIKFTNVDDGYKVCEKLCLHYLGNKGKQVMSIEMAG